jgi:hypothetical protein
MAATKLSKNQEAGILSGDANSNSWVVTDTSLTNAIKIVGGTHASGTDNTVVKSYYMTAKDTLGSGTKLSTANSALGTTPNAVDTIEFRKSGDFTNLTFTQIERIKLSEGVSIKLSADAILDNTDSLAYTDAVSLNPGTHYYGTLGGKKETVTLVAEGGLSTDAGLQEELSTQTDKTWAASAVELDDATVGNLVHDGAQLVWDFREAFEKGTGSGASALNAAIDNGTYVRVDGTNNADTIYGSDGVDYLTTRLGDDVINSGKGNDVIDAAGGADKVNLGEGNDMYLISGFRGLAGNGNGKTSTGEAQWVDGDTVDGGKGWDVLRITAGASDTDTGSVTLTSTNFKNMEEVQVGASVSNTAGESSVTQKVLSHFYFKANNKEALGTGVATGETLDNVVVDASTVSNALTFRGNGNDNTFIGTAKNDTFIGNGGHDILTGNAGNDTFQFGKIIAKTGTNYADAASSFTSNDYDPITDFTSGKDKIALDLEMFTAFSSVGKISATDIGTQSSHASAKLYLETTDVDVNDDGIGDSYLWVNAGGSNFVKVAELIGVTSLKATDFVVFDSNNATTA